MQTNSAEPTAQLTNDMKLILVTAYVHSKELEREGINRDIIMEALDRVAINFNLTDTLDRVKKGYKLNG